MTSSEQPSDPPTTDPVPPYGTPPDRALVFRPATVQDTMPGIELPPEPRWWIGKAAAAVIVVAVTGGGIVWASQEQESPTDVCAGAKGEFINPSHAGQAVDGNDGLLVQIQTKDVPAGCGVTVIDESSTGYYRVTDGLRSLEPGNKVTIDDQPIGSHGEVGARYRLVAVVGDAACAAGIQGMDWDVAYDLLPGDCRPLDIADITVTRP